MFDNEMPQSPADETANPTPEGGATGSLPGRMGRPATRPTTPLPAEPPVAFALPSTARAAGHVPAPSRTRRAGNPLLILMLLLGLLAGSVGGGITALTVARPTAPPAATSQVVATTQPVADQTTNAIGALYKHAAPSVVDIKTTVGGNGRFSGSGEGSGIVLDTGHVLTNNHVIAGATQIEVTLQDGTTVSATVAGTSPQDDIAVLNANLPADKVTPAVLGDSSAVQVGEEVVAIGSPFGLDYTVTAGIVSAVDRMWSSGNQPTQAMIQTDAPINPGNSGGPLLNMQGQVIGINTAIESPVEGSVGVGFSIPINRAKALVSQLEQGATVQHAWMGVSVTTLTPDLVSQLNTAVNQGVLVVSVTSGSPAAKAGLQGADPTTSTTAGDIITAADGRQISSADQLTSYLAGKKVGDTVTLTVVRNGQSQQVPVTLAAWPADQSTTQQQPQSPFGNGQNPFGNGSGNTP